MVERGTIGRFARWGLIHGPMWGLAAALLALPVSALVGFDVAVVPLIVTAAVGGLIGGPVLGALVGGVCVAADRAPKWIIDAPDYVAVLTVGAVIGCVAWPLLGLGQAGLAVGLLAVVLLGAAPAVDAATNAPALLHPARADELEATTVQPS